jgi:hypothetical protein
MELLEHAARALSAMIHALTRMNAAPNMVIVEPLQRIVKTQKGSVQLPLLERAVRGMGIEEMETAPIPQNVALIMGSAEFLQPIVNLSVLDVTMDVGMESTVTETIETCVVKWMLQPAAHFLEDKWNEGAGWKEVMTS